MEQNIEKLLVSVSKLRTIKEKTFKDVIVLILLILKLLIYGT